LRKFLYHIVLYLNILFAVVLLLSYLSVYINPAKCWYFAFIGLSYPFFLAVNVLFLIYWTVRWKKAAIISLVVVSIGWTYITDYYRPGFMRHKKEQVKEGSHSFRLMTYNVRIFNLYKWLKNSSRSQIVDYIKSQSPNILCLQEFYIKGSGPYTIDNLDSDLKKTPFHHIAYTYSNNNKSFYGIATFSAYPIINRGSIRFSNSNNICIYTDVVIKDDTIRIYNSHLQSIHLIKRNYDFIDSIYIYRTENRLEGVKDISSRLRRAYIARSKQVDKIVANIKKSPYRVIVCGDFNDTPISYTYHKMKDRLDDAFVESGQGLGNTYSGSFPSFRIDYILHSKGLPTYDFECMKVELSDHYPLFCSFRLN
jgi:endonuclease/exonuclease/phosphatase family metal-dependent hydrolase